jgi:hypothetical protein
MGAAGGGGGGGGGEGRGEKVIHTGKIVRRSADFGQDRSHILTR